MTEYDNEYVSSLILKQGLKMGALKIELQGDKNVTVRAKLPIPNKWFSSRVVENILSQVHEHDDSADPTTSSGLLLLLFF